MGRRYSILVAKMFHLAKVNTITFGNAVMSFMCCDLAKRIDKERRALEICFLKSLVKDLFAKYLTSEDEDEKQRLDIAIGVIEEQIENKS